MLKKYTGSLSGLVLLLFVIVACNNGTGDTKNVDSVAITGAQDTMLIGSTLDLVATVTGDEGVSQNVTWTSSDEAVATVDEDGLVNALTEGETTITATSTADDTKSDSVDITVVAAATVDAVDITGAADVSVGATLQLAATVTGSAGVAQTVTWASSDDAIATIDADGLVTAVAEGTVTITATSTVDDTKSATADINVVAAATVDTVEITGAADVSVGATLQLAATVTGSAGVAQTVTWASSDDAIATIDADGLVTAVAEGTVTITATSTVDDTKSATTDINVVAVAQETTISGQVGTDQGDAAAGAEVSLLIDGVVQGSTVTDPEGNFEFAITAGEGARANLVVSSNSAAPAGFTTQQNARNFSTASRIINFEPGTSYTGINITVHLEKTLSSSNPDVPLSQLKTDDVSVIIEGDLASAGVVGGSARSYSPRTNPGAFPGDFDSESEGTGLVSAGFVSVNLVGAQNNRISTLQADDGEPITVRLRFLLDQAALDVLRDDSDFGSEDRPDRIDVPLYYYDEELGDWVLEDSPGWLENGQGILIPESELSNLQNGTYEGSVYMVGDVDHFSWYNLDYRASRTCITGVLLDSGGNPLPSQSATVLSVPAPTSLATSTFSNRIFLLTNADGRFTIRLPRSEAGPGDDWNRNGQVDTFAVTVTGTIDGMNYVSNNNGQGIPVTTRPETDGCTEVSITLPIEPEPTPELLNYNITVVDQNNAPVAGVEVDLTNPSLSLSTSGNTDADGQVTLTLRGLPDEGPSGTTFYEMIFSDGSGDKDFSPRTPFNIDPNTFDVVVPINVQTLRNPIVTIVSPVAGTIFDDDDNIFLSAELRDRDGNLLDDTGYRYLFGLFGIFADLSVFFGDDNNIDFPAAVTSPGDWDIQAYATNGITTTAIDSSAITVVEGLVNAVTTFEFANPNARTYAPGNTEILEVIIDGTGNFDGATITSDNPSVASISNVTPSGSISTQNVTATLTAIADGTATITATSTVDPTKTATLTVTVDTPDNISELGFRDSSLVFNRNGEKDDVIVDTNGTGNFLDTISIISEDPTIVEIIEPLDNFRIGLKGLQVGTTRIIATTSLAPGDPALTGILEVEVVEIGSIMFLTDDLVLGAGASETADVQASDFDGNLTPIPAGLLNFRSTNSNITFSPVGPDSVSITAGSFVGSTQLTASLAIVNDDSVVDPAGLADTLNIMVNGTRIGDELSGVVENAGGRTGTLVGLGARQLPPPLGPDVFITGPLNADGSFTVTTSVPTFTLDLQTALSQVYGSCSLSGNVNVFPSISLVLLQGGNPVGDISLTAPGKSYLLFYVAGNFSATGSCGSTAVDLSSSSGPGWQIWELDGSVSPQVLSNSTVDSDATWDFVPR